MLLLYCWICSEFCSIPLEVIEFCFVGCSFVGRGTLLSYTCFYFYFFKNFIQEYSLCLPSKSSWSSPPAPSPNFMTSSLIITAHTHPLYSVSTVVVVLVCMCVLWLTPWSLDNSSGVHPWRKWIWFLCLFLYLIKDRKRVAPLLFFFSFFFFLDRVSL